MKKLLTVIILMVFCLNNKAQIHKGVMMLGGNFNMSSNSQKSTSTDTSFINPTTSISNYASFHASLSYGYFVTDHVMVGIFGGYGQNSGDNEFVQLTSSYYPSQKTNSNAFIYSGGLFTRYYKMLGKSKFAAYGQFTAGYGAGKSSSYGSSSSHNNNTQINAFINPGIVYFVSKHLAVEASFGNIGYNWQKSESVGTYPNSFVNTSSGFNSNLSFSLSNLFLGINFYFGGGNGNEKTAN